MQTTSRVAAGVLAAVAAVAAITTANAQTADPTATPAEPPAPEVTTEGADGDLVERLVALEANVPAMVPSSVVVDDATADARIEGAFGEARIAFDGLEGELTLLFTDADDAGTATGAAVALAAEGLLLERQAVLQLEEADDLDVDRPVDSSNATTADDIAIDADDPNGTTLVGVRLLLDARAQQLAGYFQLDGVDPVLAARFDALDAFAEDTAPLLRDAVGIPSEQLLVPVERFDAPAGQARATAAGYVCVDRVTYTELTASGATPTEAAVVALVEPDAGCGEVLDQDANAGG